MRDILDQYIIIIDSNYNCIELANEVLRFDSISQAEAFIYTIIPCCPDFTEQIKNAHDLIVMRHIDATRELGEDDDIEKEYYYRSEGHLLGPVTYREALDSDEIFIKDDDEDLVLVRTIFSLQWPF